MHLNRFILLAFAASFSMLMLSAQNPQGSFRSVDDHGIQGIDVSWHFGGITTHPVEVEGEVYQYVRVKDFTHTKEVGKPALPCYHELIAVPQGAVVQVQIINSEWIEVDADYPVHPALQPATDTYGAPEPDFEIDAQFYSTDQFYPNDIVVMESLQYWRELGYGAFTIHPVQYNPVRKILRICTSLQFKVQFSGGSTFLNVNQHSGHFLSMVARPFLNGGSIQQEIDLSSPALLNVPTTPGYIIITHTNYLAAAEQLAAWKQQLGHVVEIISGNSWTNTTVQSAVQSRYNTWTPKPDFLLIIGDHPDVPGKVITGSYGTYATDLYYVCMGGGNDFVADMARGRISVTSLTEASNIVNKIIQYEMNPPEDSSFYANSVHAAYFQHLSNGYAERRFAQTSEEIRDYMVNVQGYNVSRVYYTESTVSPTNWNNGLYSAGEPIPLYLRKPTFPWTGNASQINAAINSGISYIMHRDHGYETGWGDPAYSNTNINALTNGNKTPIVFTINCLTGKYYYGECFSERFMRKYPGGAVGVFGHAEVSLSGYNDALAFGLFDAIWASPGCIPVFTGSGGINQANPQAHPKIFTMGDVTNHGLIKMTQTWGTHQYTNELLHYFGDPAMRIFTKKPLQITVAHPATLQCGLDTTLALFSTNAPNALATLVVDGEMVAMAQLTGGAAILNFSQLSGAYAILTISDTNMIPRIDTIIITGGCPKSKFSLTAANYCIAETVTFSDMSSGTIATYAWNFGSNATPATATGAGPHMVNYATGGMKTVTLTVTGAASHMSTTTFFMDSICRFTIPTTGNGLIDLCTGQLQDDGGDQNYSNSSNGVITISPPGASSVNLLFSTFSFENNADYLRIYNGPNTSSPLIGAFTGTNLPGTSGMVSSTTGSITLQQTSNASNTQSGFRCTFQCAYPNSAPLTNFMVSDSVACTGEVTFTDLSFNGPVSWMWYFGDGDSSSMQHPQHQYLQNGSFDVTLVTTNAFGTSTLVKPGYVNINMPMPPLSANTARCKAGTVTFQATGNGTIHWYNVPTGGQPFYTGASYTTPVLSQTTSYYLETEMASPFLYGGKPDNSGGGANLTYEHYLVFNCFKPVELTSVLVYAQGAANRTIQLQNSSGAPLQSKTVNIPNGTSRVTLNFDVQPGTNLRLVCTGTPNLYRSNAGLNYPYTIPGILTIHSSSATSSPTGYYYYFYDWEVREPSCYSPRVQVDAIISDSIRPVSQYTYAMNTNQVQFTNQSVMADTYLWSFGDGNYSTLEHPLHVYQAMGDHAAILYAINDCGTDSTSKLISITTGIYETGESGRLHIYPNPTRHNLVISHQQQHSGTIKLVMLDPSGRKVKETGFTYNTGNNEHTLNISELPSGAYLLRIEGKDILHHEKIIVAP